MYHDDPDRLFYNTGNRKNTNKRCGLSNCHQDEENYSEDSLLKRFKYFKCKKPIPDFQNLQRPEFKNREKMNQHILEHWMFNPDGKVIELESGMIICKNMLSRKLLDQLGEAALMDYPNKTDARNNVTNINRDFDSKLNDWLASGYATSPLSRHEMKELRWTTLGRHHNWLETTPGGQDNAGKIPELLDDLGKTIAELLEMDTFYTEASIINYYPANNSTIGIHRDDADYQVAPIMTISLGCPAVFQIGVGERGEKSLEIFLEDGDICILDAKDRSAFHAVPRILDFELAKSNSLHCDYNYSNQPLDSYLKQARINISLRQITPNKVLEET